MAIAKTFQVDVAADPDCGAEVRGASISGASVLIGGTPGLIAGAAVGALLYAGMLRIPMRWFFAVTSVLIVLLAAGMASRMSSFLIQADLLPSLRTPLWDTSSALPIDSIWGVLLHALAGYEPTPDGCRWCFTLPPC